ncbi:multiprotein-bridging factor 1 family protein [Nocardiopsis dassonvillei]|uniref:helix-turn-helix domain-containing protein n=1 Tax=Nocardiopsis dassonvillei TaxID=2014 RepID=UPI00366EDA27
MAIDGQAIRAARQQRGWSQMRLATELGTYPARIGLWERGQQAPSGDYTLALARVLDIDLRATPGAPEVAR